MTKSKEWKHSKGRKSPSILFVGHHQRGKDKKPKRLFLKEQAEKFRKRPTGAEAEFEKKLEAIGVEYEFQRVVRYGGLDFIYDFHIKKPRKLFVEIDGGYHQTDTQRQTDRIKDFICQKRLYQPIIRLTNEQAITITEEELERLIA